MATDVASKKIAEADVETQAVEMSLLPHEEQYPHKRDGLLPRWGMFAILRILAEAVLVVALLVLCVALRFTVPRVMQYGDTNLLQVPSGPRKFTRDVYYLQGSMFTNATLLEEMLPRFWELSSDERGFVRVDGMKTTFGPPLHTDIGGLGERESYTVSYFHQMHCIAKVTALYAEARIGTNNGPANDGHMAHCLDVLRQAIMCLADGTLENGKDAWEVVHQCRDYTKVQDWAAERAVWNWTDLVGRGHRIDIP